MTNGNGNGNGDSFRLSKATLVVLIAIGSPIAGLSVGGYMLREQVKVNEAQALEIKKQQETIRDMERDAWNLERDVKELREDVDDLMKRSQKDRQR